MTFELASKYGTPYYDNQIPGYRGAGEGISCYQCLAGDELVPVAGSDGRITVRPIQDLFKAAAKNGRRIDPFGTEFAYYDGMAPSVDFATLDSALRPFRGVMRRRYTGDLLRITLESGRAITVTPDHPVYHLNGDGFARAAAGDLKAGDYLPVLKAGGFCESPVTEIDVAEVLAKGGHAGEVRATEETVNIRGAKHPGLPRILPVSRDLAAFLGYYLAAGSSERTGRRYTVRLSLPKHGWDLAADAAGCIRAALGFEPQVRKTATGTDVIVNSKLVYLLIDALGCGSSEDRTVPDLLFNLDATLVGDYLGAAFSVGERRSGRRARSIRLTAPSREAAQKLVWLAQQIGVQMNYVEREMGIRRNGDGTAQTAHVCRITDQDQIDRFVSATGCSAETPRGRQVAGPFARLPRIGFTAVACASRCSLGDMEGIQVSLVLPPISRTAGESRLADGDVHPLRIRSIEPVEHDGYVYDLVDVADTHTFANALGIVTGNCCAYQFSSLADEDAGFEDKLYFREGKHFSMGSWQVMSINCPRAAYKAEGDQERLFAELKALMDIAVDLFRIKRRWMSLIRTNGRMPFAMQRPKDPNTGERGAVAVDLEGLVYTIGVVGVNEMVQHFTGHQLASSRRSTT